MPGKRGGNKGIARAHKEQLRAEAEERAKVRRRRSVSEQLDLIEKRPGNSWRERERLEEERTRHG